MLYIHETLKIHLSKCDIFNFIVSLFYHTPFKSYSPDFNPTTDIEDRLWTRGQFANQTTILGLHAIVKLLHEYNRLMSENMLMKFREEIKEIVRVVAPEIKFCLGQITHKLRNLETSFVTYCLDKANILTKFCDSILCGTKVMARDSKT